MTAHDAPDWLAAAMPPGYRNRLEEIQRLTRDLDEMGRFGRLLYATGSGLRDAVIALFAAAGLDVESGSDAASPVVVHIDGRRRLLVHVVQSDAAVQRRGSELAQILSTLHQVSEEHDRVVLAGNAHPLVRPADRGEGVEADTLAFLKRLGANYVSGATLFAIWSRAVEDRADARAIVERLHAQDGGVFALPIAVGV